MYADFVKLGAAVIGVSGDSDESHRSFATNHRLPFSMIADRDGSLRRLFCVPYLMFLLPGRATYVIDRNGIVQLKFISHFFGSRHVEQALATVRKLAANTET